jgi:putative SOS response-associated peptidase YedK
VPADGFFEWQKLDAKNKQPWAIGLANDAPFAFAGLWERWKDKVTQQPLETFTILTTEPNELTAPIHNRMPVILAPRDYERWLEPADPAQLPVDLLRPRPADEMTAWKVANVANDAAPNPDWL